MCLACRLWRWCLPKESQEGSFYSILFCSAYFLCEDVVFQKSPRRAHCLWIILFVKRLSSEIFCGLILSRCAFICFKEFLWTRGYIILDFAYVWHTFCEDDVFQKSLPRAHSIVFCIRLAYFLRRCCLPEESPEDSFYSIFDMCGKLFVKLLSSRGCFWGFTLLCFYMCSA